MQGLFIKYGVIKVFARDACLFKAKFNRLGGEVIIMFLPRKTFFHRRRDDLPIFNQGRRRIVIKTGDA